MVVISLLTYNVWFNNYYIKDRINHICKLILDIYPDFISLQEVTLPIFVILKKNLDRYYHFSISFEITKYNYGTIILSKFPIIEHIIMPLSKTYMSRKYHQILVKKGSKLLKIISIHLESDYKSDIKYEQLAEIFDKIDKKDNVFIMGDTNMEEHVMLPDYLEDVETDYTFDSTKNANIRGKFQSRLDRIFMNKRCKIIKNELIGTNVIYDNVYPSDHFGIYLEVSL